MNTTKLGAEIVNTAISWLDSNCVEKGANNLYCNNKAIKWKDYGVVLDSGKAYCAAFACSVINTACKRFGIKVRMPLSPSTYVLSDYAKKQNNNQTLAVGAIGVRRYLNTDGGYTGSGHAVIIVEVKDGKVYTIEGNTGRNGVEGVLCKTYPYETFLNGTLYGEYPHNGHLIIHSELWGYTASADNPFNPESYECGKSSTGNSNKSKTNSRNYFLKK